MPRMKASFQIIHDQRTNRKWERRELRMTNPFLRWSLTKKGQNKNKRDDPSIFLIYNFQFSPGRGVQPFDTLTWQMCLATFTALLGDTLDRFSELNTSGAQKNIWLMSSTLTNSVLD